MIVARVDEQCTAVAELTQSVLGKQLPVIAITVQYIDAEAWFIGGQSLAALGKSAFHLDISITDETNTKAEKARYLREVHAAMANALSMRQSRAAKFV